MGTKNKRTIYLGLDYTDFTGGVSEVNRKMGLLDAEFKLAQEQVKNYGNATDSLGVKQDYLKQKIELQSKKVEAAKKAYDDAMSSQKASEKQIDALDKKLLQERIALEKLEGQLRDTEKEQEELNKDTESFGDVIRGLASDLGLSVSPAIEKLAKKFDGVSKSVGTAILGVSGIITGFAKCSVEAAKAADDILTLASTTGVSTDELQKLKYAAEFVDVSVEDMASSMHKLTAAMNSSREGSKDMQAAFQKLHVSVKDSKGALRDTNEVFYETIDKLGKIKNESERDAIAMKIFGESASKLNPLIAAGSQKLKELGVEADKLGIIIGEKDLKAMGGLSDAMDKFDKTSESLKNSLGVVLLPILTRLFEVISGIPVPVLKTLVILASVIATIVLVVKAIKSVTDTGKALKSMFTLVNGGMSKTTLIIMGVVAALIALAAIIAVIAGKKDDLKDTMNSISQNVTGLQNTVAGAQTQTYRVANHASGTANFQGGRTWVGEAGPELVTLPRGTRITPAEESGRTEYNTFYVTIDAKNVDDFNRVVEIAKRQKVAVRRGLA